MATGYSVIAMIANSLFRYHAALSLVAFLGAGSIPVICSRVVAARFDCVA
ncbi:MAG: hypothetical protein V4579_10870 [Pseudomonadota bacterium]